MKKVFLSLLVLPFIGCTNSDDLLDFNRVPNKEVTDLNIYKFYHIKFFIDINISHIGGVVFT